MYANALTTVYQLSQCMRYDNETKGNSKYIRFESEKTFCGCSRKFTVYLIDIKCKENQMLSLIRIIY